MESTTDGLGEDAGVGTGVEAGIDAGVNVGDCSATDCGVRPLGENPRRVGVDDVNVVDAGVGKDGCNWEDWPAGMVVGEVTSASVGSSPHAPSPKDSKAPPNTTATNLSRID